MTREKSIYEKIGGEEVLQEVVLSFYKKILDDEDFKPFFEGVKMETQFSKMKSFLMVALGGPGDFTGKGLSATHKRVVSLGLSEHHFNKFTKTLKETLKDHGASEDVLDAVCVLFKVVKPDILNN